MNGERVNRILWLDFLRAFAMLYIVAIHHVDDYGNQLFQSNFDDIFTYALLGMFVLLSGYLLAMANWIRTGSDIKKFLKKRLLRIYPLYVMSLLLFFCFFPERLPTALLFQHLILYNMISGDSVFTLWFVTMICLFYLLFPVLIYNYSVKRVIVVSAVLFVLLLPFDIVRAMEGKSGRSWSYLQMRLFSELSVGWIRLKITHCFYEYLQSYS